MDGKLICSTLSNKSPMVAPIHKPRSPGIFWVLCCGAPVAMSEPCRAGAPTRNIPAPTQSLDAVTGATCRSTQRLPVQRQLSPLCQLRPEAIMFVTGSSVSQDDGSRRGSCPDDPRRCRTLRARREPGGGVRPEAVTTFKGSSSPASNRSPTPMRVLP